MLDVVDLMNVITLMYYRFVHDSSYAHFVTICQEVNFIELFILQLIKYVPVPIRLLSRIDQYINLNLLFSSMEYSIKLFTRRKYDKFQNAIHFNE